MIKLPFSWSIRTCLAVLSGTAALIGATALFSELFPVESKITPVEPPVLLAAPPMPPSGPVDFDFDGDGEADIARWHPATSEFKVKNSDTGTYSTYTIGSSSAKAAPGDYDDDQKTDAAVFNAGTWTIKESSAAPTATPTTEIFGQAGDIPMAADYDGDGETDLSIIRPSTNTWWVKRSTDGAIVPQSAGNTTDIPVPGDYDGDGKTDIALYRPATGGWTINYSLNGSTGTATWGQAGTDVPVPADYDADGKTDLAIFRRSTGTWYVVKSNGGAWLVQAWGNYGDQPVPADYDGDNKADFSVWRPTTGVWHTIKSQSGVFDSQFLGQAGDMAVPAAYLKQVGGTVSAYDLAQSRLSPKNATGGTDLYSRNFSWGTSLVSLPGRAGLNAGFGISYNSLVWTRSGSEIYFDADTSNVSPGFRMGFPTIEPVYLDGKTGNFAYLMVTPSGGRVEFRQIGASNVYETADSSYVQLKAPTNSNPNDPVENLTLIVTGTDGTQMTYIWKGGAFRCSQIKDRNGNYITIVHNDHGQLTSMTDTLGRVVTVSYDDWGQPSAIKQMWGSGTNGSGNLTAEHTWATFSYAPKTVTTDIDGSIAKIGPPNDTVLRVLDKITYADQSSTRFHYNGYAQVYQVENHAADTATGRLNYFRMYSLEFPNGNQFDCPKFTDRRTWAKDFNNENEVITNNSITTGQTYSVPEGISGTATKVDVWIAGHPNNLISRTFVSESGWKEGLPIATEDWTEIPNSWTRQRWTWTDFTQDNTSLSYPLNPRVIESRVGDGTNTKKTSIEYHMTGTPAVAQYGLVKKVEVGDLSTVKKRTETDYNLSSTYTGKRIIGLPKETRAWGRNDLTGNLDFVSKATFVYDQWTFTGTQDLQNPTQHDEQNYSDSYVSGRGNLTTTTRCDVTNSGEIPDSTCGGGISSTFQYNTAGAVVSKTTPWDGTNTRTVSIGYTDRWSDDPDLNDPNPNRTTYAYPTTLTDPAGNSSTVNYRYDIGANVWAKSPAPQDQAQGKITEREYDSVGRLVKDKIVNYGGAYTRYEYPTSGIQSKVFSTIVDSNSNNIGDTADEVLSESWTDGAGRVLKSRTPHTFNPDGSTATWAGTLTEYNILGQITKRSVPTEVNAGWAPTGDDLSRGWLWTHQKYDWKGRVVRKISTDGVDSPTLNDSDVLISYEGCGCAGGQITTIQSENVPRDDQPTLNARRTHKVYEDTLGRRWKTVVMKWDGTPYTTTEEFFNGRGQIIRTRQTDNTDTDLPQAFQDTTTEFDGHGRVWKTHSPEQQDSSGNATFNITTYNLDDSISSVTDGRGASASYTYNNLGLVTRKDYSVPQGSGIAVTPPDIFSYDSLGNRTQMTDATGTTNYSYDELSRITSETKQFSDLTESFVVSYAYTLSGAVRQITLPNSTSVSYVQDKIGRTAAVSGQGFMAGSTPVSNIVSEIKYRAWGATKSINHGSAAGLMTMTYDNTLKVTSFKIPNYLEKDYQYNSDGRVKFIDTLNLNGVQANTFDRSFSYDHTGILKQAKTGEQANGGTAMTGPFNETFEFDAFDNPAGRTTVHWDQTYSFQSSYTQNRRSGWQYDVDGNLTVFDGITNTIDAAGLTTKVTYPTEEDGGPNTFYRTYSDKTQTHDGDGDLVAEVAKTDRYRHIGSFITHMSARERKEFNVKSTVLGGLNVYTYSTNYFWQYGGTSAYTSWMRKANLFIDGKLLAISTFQSGNPPWPNFEWKHNDPTSSIIGTTGPDYRSITAALDPTGADVGLENPYVDPNPPEPPPPFHGEYADPEETELVEVDGVLTPLALFPGLASVVSRCPKQGCGPLRTENGWEWWTAFADGYEGYMPMGAHYAGGGRWSWQTQDQRRRNREKPPVLKNGGKRKKPTGREAPNIDPRTEEEIFDVDNIRIGINTVWSNPDCKSLLTDMLQAVATKNNPLLDNGNIPMLFERLIAQRGGGLSRRFPSGSLGYGNATGTFRQGNAMVHLAAPNINLSWLTRLISDVTGTIEELRHLAGSNRRYTDREFADEVRDNPYWAANNFSLPGQPHVYPLDIPGLNAAVIENLRTNPGHASWSAFHHNVVGNLCFNKIGWKAVPFLR